MIDVRVTISEDLQRLPELLRNGLLEAQQDAGRRMIEASQQSLNDKGAVATGTLSAGIAITEQSLARTTVLAPIPARFIEEGRPPGPVPRWSVFEPMLRRWAIAKGLRTDGLYGIAVKIRREGYKGRWPFRAAVAVVSDEIEQIYLSAIGRNA